MAPGDTGDAFHVRKVRRRLYVLSLHYNRQTPGPARNSKQMLNNRVSSAVRETECDADEFEQDDRKEIPGKVK